MTCPFRTLSIDASSWQSRLTLTPAFSLRTRSVHARAGSLHPRTDSGPIRGDLFSTLYQKTTGTSRVPPSRRLSSLWTNFGQACRVFRISYRCGKFGETKSLPNCTGSFEDVMKLRFFSIVLGDRRPRLVLECSTCRHVHSHRHNEPCSCANRNRGRPCSSRSADISQ